MNIDVDRLLVILEKAADNSIELSNQTYQVDDRKYNLYINEIGDIGELITEIKAAKN